MTGYMVYTRQGRDERATGLYRTVRAARNAVEDHYQDNLQSTGSREIVRVTCDNAIGIDPEPGAVVLRCAWDCGPIRWHRA